MFPYTPDNLQQLENCFSKARLERYLAACEDDSIQAYELYAWNIAIGEALLGPIQGLEVILRNHLHNQLTAAFSETWFDRISLEQLQQTQIKKAKAQCKKGYTPGHLIAELTFSFWVGLLSSKYEMSLWRPYLHKCFRHLPENYRRKSVHKTAKDIRDLRNRIAHHEPIFDINLKAHYQSILDLTGWLNSIGSEWISAHSNFEKTLLLKPQHVQL